MSGGGGIRDVKTNPDAGGKYNLGIDAAQAAKALQKALRKPSQKLESFPRHSVADIHRALTQDQGLAAQESHRKIAMTTVAASGLATIPLQKSQGFSLRRSQKIASC